jgi:hypothetical protein
VANYARTTIVDALARDNEQLVEYLRDKGEISLLSFAENAFRKYLLLAAASYFEDLVKQIVLDVVRHEAGRASPLIPLIRKKIIEREYHKLFDWNASNANQFFGLWGEEFRERMKNHHMADQGLSEGIRAFMELGRLRNQLVHGNFAVFEIEKTPGEIYDIYRKAIVFLCELPIALREHAAACRKAAPAE